MPPMAIELNWKSTIIINEKLSFYLSKVSFSVSEKYYLDFRVDIDQFLLFEILKKN